MVQASWFVEYRQTRTSPRFFFACTVRVPLADLFGLSVWSSLAATEEWGSHKAILREQRNHQEPV